MNVWQPDRHKDRLDEFVSVALSMQPPRAKCVSWMSLPTPPALPAPLACLCQYLKVPGQIPFNANLCRTLKNLFYFPLPIYLFSHSLSRLLPQLREEAIKRQRRPRKDEQRRPRSRPNGGFLGGECGQRRWNVELSGLKGGWFPLEDSTSSGHKGCDWGLLGKAANTCSLFRGHNREVKLQSLPPESQRPPPMGLSCPGVAGTTKGTAKGSLGPGL